MTGKIPENHSKNPEKAFKKPVNPRGMLALPFYIEEVLKIYQGKQHPLTVPDLQKKILEAKRIFYTKNAIRNTLHHFHRFSPSYMLSFTRVSATRTKSWAYSLIEKTHPNV